MLDFKLTSAPPLAGYDQSFEDITLKACADFAIVSFALPLGGEKDAEKAIKTAYGVAVPAVGKSVATKDGKTRLIRLSQDQGFVVFSRATPDAEPFVAGKLKGKAYTTDQTDVWVGLEIDGTASRTALERICPIDLHPDGFAVDDTARTAMEHLGVLIVRTGEDSFLLMSATSSAKSFLHAIETSIEYVT